MAKKDENENVKIPEPEKATQEIPTLTPAMQNEVRKIFGEMIVNISRMQMGFGSKTFKADQQGIWLGAKKFEDAPFRVTVEGKVYFNGVLQN